MGAYRRLVICAAIVGLSATGLTALPGLSAAADAPASAPASGPTPAPKGKPQPYPRPVSATDAASKWSLPTVTFPSPGSATVPVSASALATAGVVRVADPAALGTLGLPTLPTGSEPQPDGLPAPAGLDTWAPNTSAGAPASVQVTTLGDAARAQVGNAPMAFTVTRADGGSGSGPVAVSVNYSGWRDAYGGNYAERLELVRYPACVLTTPDIPGCSTGVPVANQVNNPYQTALTAVVDADGPAPSPDVVPTTAAADGPAPAPVPTPLPTPLPTPGPSGANPAVAEPQAALPTPIDTSSLTASPSPSPTDSPSPSPSPTDSSGTGTASGSVFVVTSSPSGPSGTYIASPLLPSAHWSVGLSSGSLDYSYPVTTPVPPGGPAPSVSLDYDSGAVDGRTSVTNPQASWVGMGWDYEPGFIEREYASCNSVGHSNADLCYTTSPINVTLTLGGSTTHVIQDTDGTWRLQDDPGWTVTNGTGANNGDTTGEFWKLQSPDGTIYYFGRGVGVSGTAATNSAWTVPVFGYPGTLCSPNGTFTSCTKAWRWNLDYVVRTNNNETTYTYAQETNAYNVNGVAVAKSYVRGGHVSSITYGLRDGDTSTPVDKVAFGAVGRCTAKMNGGTGTCPTLGPANASSYPDVPTDLVCATGATTCTQNSPSFWTVSMMTDIETFTLSSGAYQMLDDYVLQQQLPDPDGSGPEAPALWMSRVQHFGEDGAAISTPPLYTFGTVLPNRFDVTAGVSPVDMYRVAEIENETGGFLAVNYDTPDPCTTTLENGDHSNNTLDCFPVHWVPHGSTTWAAGWFNKYLITRAGQYVNYLGEVAQSSTRTVTSEPIVTDYQYVGGAAWHKNGFEVNPTLSDSWSVYRGYQTVRVLEREVANTVIGASSESVTVHQFYRGMYGDLNNDGSTKTNTVSTAEWGAANDYAWLAGREAEVLVESAGGTVDSTTDTLFWTSQTAAMAMPSPNPSEVAREVQPQTTMIRTPNSDGSTRRHEIVDVHYEASSSRSISNGAVVTHVDAGDISGTDGEANCTNIQYVANTSRYLMAPEVTATYAGTAAGSSCPGTNTLLGHKELFYDQTADSSMAPTNADLERSRIELTGSTYADSYATYDNYGRVLSSTDPNSHVTTTAYTPTTGRPTSVAVSSPALSDLNGGKLTTTSILDLRGAATQVTDANGNVSKETYDALGRLTSASAPTESGGSTPTFTASYSVNNNDWSTVETKHLLTTSGIYSDTWTYLDGWQRTRETHTSSFGGVGHLTVQTRYGDTGEVASATSPYYNTGALNVGADYTDRANVPLEVDYGYDPMHRVVNQSRIIYGVQSWGHTATTYFADRVVTTPPSPAPVTTATIDVWGRPLVSTETSQVSGDSSTSTTTYGYDGLGRLTSVADAAHATNTYTYDVGGRRIGTTDADAGSSSSAYDAAGNLQTTTDALGTTVTTTYDELNRPLKVTSNGHTSPDFPSGALIDYTYDSATRGKGLPATTTVHDLGAGTGDWTTSVGGYDADGRGLSTTYTLPAVSGQTTGISYQTSATYNPSGQPSGVTENLLGDQAAETLTYAYEITGGVTGLPTTLTGPAGVTATNTYSSLNQLGTRTLGASGAGQVVRSYSFTDPLRRLSEISTTADAGSGPVTVQDDAYSYDDVDNPTRINDKLTAAPDLNQQTCFTYDGLDRLATAWTEAANCNNWTSTTAADPYGFNQEFAYHANGTPASVTNLGGTATAYGMTDANHPHAVTTYGGNTYAYDGDGQQSTRTIGGASTALSWDPLHHLYQSVDASGTTKYVNAPDGTRIARLDPDGSTTIWMAGNEVHVANGVTTDTRYYGIGGATVAQRNSTGLTWLTSDGQNSRQIAVNASTGVATRTYYLPYGAVRTGAPALPTDQNFLGRVLDGSGLLQDGARYYDPSMGQFVSPDPLANASDNSTLDPYGYGASNPIGFADPTGLMNQPDSGGGCGSMSLTQCQTAELAAEANMAADPGDVVASVQTQMLNSLAVTPGPQTAMPLIAAITDIFVQGINDTKGGFVDLVNTFKNDGVNSVGGVSAIGCGANCAAMGPPPPLIQSSDVPDLSVPDVPMPFTFPLSKSVLQVGGILVSLLLPGAIAKVGKILRLFKGAEDATVLSKVDRVGSALKDDPFHRSVSWVVDDPNARKFVFQGGDGVQRTLYQLLGEMNGKPGVFEWILDESGSKPVIVHQRFIPGGSITGYPNQVP
jgi:RHS repeat-associated protein